MKKSIVLMITLAVLGLFFTVNGRAEAETLIMSVSPLECNVGDTITVTYHGAPGNSASNGEPGTPSGCFRLMRPVSARPSLFNI